MLEANKSVHVYAQVHSSIYIYMHIKSHIKNHIKNHTKNHIKTILDLTGKVMLHLNVQCFTFPHILVAYSRSDLKTDWQSIPMTSDEKLSAKVV